MARRAITAVLVVAALAAGGTDAGADRSSDPLPALHAEPDPVNGGRIVDEEGREVLLRGVNVNALAEYWEGTDFPTTFPLKKGDPARMASMGWNAVRLLLSWSKVEPEPGEYDEAYLDRVARTVDRLADVGIYTIIDLHQDAWGASLAGGPDEVCEPPQTPALGWDGAPEWATLDGGASRCWSGIRELSPAVTASWTAFFADQPAADGVGVQTHYVEMLGHVAERFADESAVAGVDLINEPNAFSDEHQAALSAMYGRALTAIRAGEEEGDGFPHLVLFEPSAIWSSTGRGAPPDFPRDENVVYAPHLYTGGFTNGPSPPRRSRSPARRRAGSVARRCCRASGDPVPNGPARPATATSWSTSGSRTSSASAPRSGPGGRAAATPTRRATSVRARSPRSGASSRSTAPTTRSSACAPTWSPT